ncbi:MAG: M28 family peptidase [Saprospiraceae bacterium]|nr:M28 family peptidase [Saprospiraceae bacterium]
MLKKNFYFYSFLALSLPVFGQFESGVSIPNKEKAIVADETDPAVKFAKTITAEDLKKHLTIIASPAYEGRETGQPGNVKAATYIAKQFDAYLLDQAPGINDFRQPVDFTFSSWDDTDIYVNGARFRHLWDYLAFPTKNGDLPLLESKEVLFVGFGIDSPNYTDYKGKDKDFKGKIIVINKGEPMKADSTYWISGTRETSEWSSLEKKLMTAKAKGVSLVLIIEDDIKKAIGENRNQLMGPTVQLGDHTKDVIAYPNHAYISTTIAKELFGKEDEKIIKERENIKNKGKFKPVKLKSHFQINLKKKVNGIKSQNVIGVIPGKSKPDEVVIVSAHFDHLGKKGDQIFHGADDNGSGTSTIMELAQAFAEARGGGFRPERTVVFMLVTGEEKGLLGSEYYVNNPLYPLANTVADVNVDMVGRQDDKYKDNPDYIYVIGSDRLSTDLHKINESVNQKYCQLTLDYTYNSESDPNRYYYRSDHYNFAEKGIPAIFYFNGVHADYHQPTDTADKINYEKMAKVGRLIFHTIWELANRPERIVVDVKPMK